MVEYVPRMVNVEEVLRGLRDRGLRIFFEVGQDVVQEIRMRLHVCVEDDHDVVVARRLLREDVEFQCRIDVSGLAMDGHARPLVACEVDQALVAHEHALLLSFEVPPVVEHVDVHLGPLVLERERCLASGEDDVRRLVVARHAAMHGILWRAFGNTFGGAWLYAHGCGKRMTASIITQIAPNISATQMVV